MASYDPSEGAGEATAGFFSSFPILNMITGGIASGVRGAQRSAAFRDLKEALEALRTPNFDPQSYTPEFWEPAAYETPEAAQATQIAIDPQLRQLQLENLAKTRDLGEGYGASLSEAAQRLALQQANQQAQGQTEAALANAQARGVGGGGLEFALRQQGSQDAANRSLMGGLQGAQQMALQRLMAGQNYQQGLGSLRGQDTDLAAANADIANRFNMTNIGARNEARQRYLDMLNKSRQERAAGTTAARLYGQERKDRLSQQDYENRFKKLLAGNEYTVSALGDQSRTAQAQQEAGLANSKMVLDFIKGMKGG